VLLLSFARLEFKRVSGLEFKVFQSTTFFGLAVYENTRKYMHAETLALLTKLLCFPNMKYCHGNTII
jgi:hypothetical protein